MEVIDPHASAAVGEAVHCPQDLALARRAADRCEKAWREIYDRTRDRLFALLVYHTGQREEALELLQETYLSALKSIHRYHGTGPLEAYLAIIAIRRARDWKRELSRRRRVLQQLAAHVRKVSCAPDDLDARRRLHQALARLGSRQRAIFLLRELEGLSFRQVAEAARCSESTARVHHFRARQKMRDFLRPRRNAGTSSARLRGAETEEVSS